MDSLLHGHLGSGHCRRIGSCRPAVSPAQTQAKLEASGCGSSLSHYWCVSDDLVPKRCMLTITSCLTAALILFVYAVTSGPVNGWGSANVIAPLVIALFMTVVFFVYEAKIEDHMAALPPRVWFYHNVPILVAVGLIPFFWWCQRTPSLTSSWLHHAYIPYDYSLLQSDAADARPLRLVRHHDVCAFSALRRVRRHRRGGVCKLRRRDQPEIYDHGGPYSGICREYAPSVRGHQCQILVASVPRFHHVRMIRCLGRLTRY